MMLFNAFVGLRSVDLLSSTATGGVLGMAQVAAGTYAGTAACFEPCKGHETLEQGVNRECTRAWLAEANDGGW